jgi:hypothetical protein
LWTIHSPKECKRQPTGKYKARKGSTGKKNKYTRKKKAYMDSIGQTYSYKEEDSEAS